MIRATLAIALFLSAARLDAQAMAEAQPDGDLSALLSVKSSAPMPSPYCHQLTRNCFRLFLEIRPRSRPSIEIGAAVTNNGVELYEAMAYTSSGSSCRSYFISGLPPFAEFRGGFSWNFGKQPFTATATKPGILIGEFDCDQAINAGDHVTAQITMLVDPDGAGPQLTRYVLSGMTIKSTR